VHVGVRVKVDLDEHWIAEIDNAAGRPA